MEILLEPATKKIKTDNFSEYNPLMMSAILKNNNIEKVKEYIMKVNYIENQHNIISLFIKEHAIYTIEDLNRLIDFFLEIKINLVMLNDFQFTPLIVCINNKFIKLAEIFIQKEIGIHVETATLLTAIIYKNLPNIMKLVLEKGVNPNAVQYDMSALMVASYHRRTEMVKLLLDYNVDYNYINSNGENTMFFACNSLYNNETSNLEIINMLLEKKININLRNNHGETPIFNASRSINKYTNLSIMTLIEAGANPNELDNFGNNPLMTLFSDSDNMNNEIIVILPIIMTFVKGGINVNHKNNMGQSIFNMMDDDMIQYYKLCSSYNTLNKINNKIYTSKECLICLEEDKNKKMVLFDKCNHCVTCFKCFQNLVNQHTNYIDIKCPYCNIHISTHTIVETL